MAGLRMDFQIKKAITGQLSEAKNGRSTTLTLQQCGLQEPDIQYIAVQGVVAITAIKFDRNNLSQESIRPLSECKWTNLTSISLASNKISNLGCKFLTKGSWKQLTTLYLVNNQIQAIGASHLSKASWKRLQLLNLNCNKIHMGIDALMKGNWTSLNRLFIRANEIEFILLKRILKAENPCLNALSLTHNMTSNDERNQLAQLIYKKFSGLTQLIMWD